MKGRPEVTEAAPYYNAYIGKASGDDVVSLLQAQSAEVPQFLRGISGEKSLYRYAPDKWSIREVLCHINDAERLFLSRAFWFARGFDAPLPSFEQMIASAAARADDFSWADRVDEFSAVRSATLSFFRTLPEEAWLRGGVASGNPFTVRALAYITAGHTIHHLAILRERYL